MFYPLKFYPIYKEKIWGNKKIVEYFKKSSTLSKIGESYELSCTNTDVSIIANGIFKGLPIKDLIKKYPIEILGQNVYNKYKDFFPLLFKFIDANDNLSIQVHPDDNYAKLKYNLPGKTEMWYIIDAEEKSYIIAGFSKKINKNEFINLLNNNEIEKVLNKIPVKAGDVIFIPAGLIHSIGKGILLAEIQQNTDITYRIYDYDRIDETGKKRELHINDALNVINFDFINFQPIKYNSVKNSISNIIKCDYFTVNEIKVNKFKINISNANNTFKVLMIIKGKGKIKYGNYTEIFTLGETILIPAILTNVEIETEEETLILETTL